VVIGGTDEGIDKTTKDTKRKSWLRTGI